MKVGTSVGCEYRWPYAHAHPDCWTKPYRGTVVAKDDPRAWARTLAFPQDRPDPAAVAAHVRRCEELYGPDRDVCPVLYVWDGEEVVMWERESALKPYAIMLRLWRSARAAAYAGLQGATLDVRTA